MRTAAYCILGGLLACCFAVDADAGWFLRDNQLAWRSWQAGDFKRSLAYWDMSSKGLFGRGTALMRLQRWREAEQNLRQALEMASTRQPDDMASIWYNLGNSLYAQDKFSQARMAWREALKYNPAHAKAQHNLEVVNRLLLQRRAKETPAAKEGDAHERQGRDRAGHTFERIPKRNKSQDQKKRLRSLPFHIPSPGNGSSQTGGQAQAGDKPARSEDSAHTPGGRGRQRKQARAVPGQGAPAKAGGDKGRALHHGGQRRQGKGISSGQAARELGMVDEGVDIFLRHRLSATRGIFTPRGPTW